MTDGTEPTIDTLKANILTEFKQVLKLAPADYTENCTNVVMSLVDEYIADQVAKARIDEIHAWFDMPKHYPGEEYLDEPFAKAKCKTPKKITYYTLDSSFTYSLKERLATLSGVKNK